MDVASLPRFLLSPNERLKMHRCSSLSYLSPVLDLGLGDVLDGHLQPVPVPHARVHDAEAALAQHVPDLRDGKFV